MPTDDSYFYAHIEGRRLNIMTTEGADAFIHDGTRPYLSSNIAQCITPARATLVIDQSSFRNETTTTQARRQATEQLTQNYIMYGCLANSASTEVFERIPATELECLANHACHVFTQLTNNRKWIKTGVLQKVDQELLDCLIPHMKHLNFVTVALQVQTNLLGVIADLCAAKTPGMPCPDFADSILCITNNARLTLMIAGWKKERTFKKLESTGILGQAIRCITCTQPNLPQDAIQGHLFILEVLMECPMLIQEKFQKGTRSGDILNNVLSGKDGYKGGALRRHELVMARLANVQKIANVTSHPPNQDALRVGLMCRKCNKSSMEAEFQNKLLVCGRCKQTYYCSKECQKEDWKEHKKTCGKEKTSLDKMEKSRAVTQNTIFSFCTNNYYDIMVQVDRITTDTNMDKKDLLLEIDFYADPQKGSAPALREPPEFKVAPTRGYLEGTRPDEPNWFYKGSKVYEKNVRQVLAGIRDHHERMTSNHILVLARYPDGQTGIYRIHLMSETSGVPLFSDEALDAFSRAMKDDDSRLGTVFGPGESKNIAGRRDFEKHQRLRDLMEQPNMLQLSNRINQLMQTDQWRQMQEELGDSDDEESNHSAEGR